MTREKTGRRLKSADRFLLALWYAGCAFAWAVLLLFVIFPWASWFGLMK